MTDPTFANLVSAIEAGDNVTAKGILMSGDPDLGRAINENLFPRDSIHNPVVPCCERDAADCNCQPDGQGALAMDLPRCGAQFVTGGPDPYSTDCEISDENHYPLTAHVGADPMGGEGKVSWRGGGSVAGDALPYTEVIWY